MAVDAADSREKGRKGERKRKGIRAGSGALELIRGAPAQAYLLVGEWPEEFARGLLSELLCPDGRGADKLERGSHPDLRWVARSGAGRRIGIEQIRALKQEALYPPSEAPYKVFVIAEAEALTLEAANSLLRLLEDPPPYLVFLLLARSLDLLPTIISRCQVVRLATRSLSQLYARLKTQGFSKEEIDYLIAVSKGREHLIQQLLSGGPGSPSPPLLAERERLRRELEELDDQELIGAFAEAEGLIEEHELALEVLGRLPEWPAHLVLEAAAAWSKLERERLDRFLEEAIFWYRDLLIVIGGLEGASPNLTIFNQDRRAELARARSELGELEGEREGKEKGKGEGARERVRARLLGVIPALERARLQLQGNANLQLLLESALLRLRGLKARD